MFPRLFRSAAWAVEKAMEPSVSFVWYCRMIAPPPNLKLWRLTIFERSAVPW